MPKPIVSENPAPAPRVDHDPYTELLNQAAALSHRYLQSMPERHVGVTQGALDNLAKLAGPLPAQGLDPNATLQLLDEIGSPATVASAGGRFFGGVDGGALPVTVAANWLAAAWDQNACLFDLSPVAAYLEDVVLGWLVSIFGLPPGCGGAFVTGTQMADVTCLAAARSAVLHHVGWDVESQGLFGAPPITVFAGEERHSTMMKAFALLGLGRDRVLFLPTDSQGRLQPATIPQLVSSTGPLILCAQVGNVNTGAFDPIREICEITRAHNKNAWIHVDGAFGLWAAASPVRKHLVDGLDLADSWATDGHKYLNVPYDSGIAIVRDAAALRRAMFIAAAYYPDPAGKREPMQWGPESSRRARVVEIWAALRTLGADGIADLIERTCTHAATFAKTFREAGFEVLNDVVLNQVLVSFGDDDATNRVIATVQAEGTCWCGGTTWKGRRAMRISVSSWATTAADVDRSSRAILSLASKETRK